MTDALPSDYANLVDDPNDARRLVVADELQQRGDPLGELIVVECELARLPPYASARRLPLQRREEALVRRHRARWLADLTLSDQEAQLSTFRRGFPHALYIATERLAERAERVKQSTIRELALTEPGSLGQVDAIALRRIETLRLHVPAAVRPFNECERLRTLDMTRGRMVAGMLAKLAEVPTLRGLTELSLPGLGVDVASFVARSEGFPALESLGLASFDVNEAGATVLAQARWKLSTLSVEGTASSAEGSHRLKSNAAQLLSKADWTRTVRTLSLTYTYVGVAAFAKVAMPALTRLTACRTLDDLAMERLAQAPWASQLVELDISENRITDAGLAKLARRPLDNLTALAFRSSDVGNDKRGANLFVDAALPKLQSLDLRGSNLGDLDIASLASAPWLSHLIELDLSRNHITEKGLERLSRAPFKALTDLAIEKNFDVGPRAFAAFREATGLEHLRIHY